MTRAHLIDLAWAAVIFVVSLVFSVGVAALVLVRLPADYFRGECPPQVFFADRPAWQRAAANLVKNIVGVLLILLGVVLSIPGVPGQGFLTILIGITLVDFRGKRRIEQRIMRIPSVFRAANVLRARFGKEPFAMPEPSLMDPARR